MKSISTISEVCFQNLRKWRTDYRVWTIAVVIFVMIQIYIDDIKTISSALGTQIPIWIFPFLYSQFYTKLIFTLPLVLLFCNAPFSDNNQIFVYMRCGKMRWLCGQVLYIFLSSAIYYLYIIAVTIISTVFIGGEMTLGWGKTLHTIAATNVSVNLRCYFVEISEIVVDFFSPLQAVWFTFLVSWFSAVIIGLVICLCNIATKTRFLGVLLSSALVVMSCLIENGGLSELIRFSPVSWNTLDNIDVGGITTNPAFEYCLSVYLALIALLITGILFFGKKQSIDTKGQ